MAKGTDSEERLAELIWRTIKLRVSLLVLTILVLLAVWSAMANGKRLARNVDIEYCQQLIAEENKEIPSAAFSAATWCTPEGARSYVEGVRATNGFLLIGWQALSEDKTKKEGAEKLLMQYRAKKTILDAYDAKRRDAFPLQIQLSSEYSGSNVTLDGHLAAELLPFCVLIVFSIIFVLGYQQTSYKRQLLSLLANSDESGDRPIRIARGQFFAGLGRDSDTKFFREVSLSPEALAIGSLYLLLAVSFAAVTYLVVSDLIHLTDSLFFSYPFALLASGFAVAIFLVKTHRRYDELFAKTARKRRSKLDYEIVRWAEIGLAAIGFLSLALPWAKGAAFLRGYNFLIAQRGVTQTGPVIVYPIDPSIFIELRLQVWFAVLFILLCATHVVFKFRRSRQADRFFAKARYLMGFPVLLLSLNYLAFMAILQYGGSRLDANPWVSLFSNFSASAPEYGNPMNSYDPAYGFVLFLMCCFGLFLLSTRETARLPICP